MTVSKRTPRKAPDFPARRKWLTLGAALPPLAVAASLGASGVARAASPAPGDVRELADAAMALFDAAESGQWAEAKAALDHAHAAARSATGSEAAYTDAGGALSDFFQARNALSGDLAEADIALSVKNQRWLIRCADRIATRAGELAEPFADKGDSRKLTLSALLFLARRVRTAALWQDADGMANASADFSRLWLTLRARIGGSQAAHANAIDAAIKKIDASATSADAKALYAAVESLDRSLD